MSTPRAFAASTLLLPALLALSSRAAAATCAGGPCSASESIDHTFSLGSAVHFSINRCPCEGLVFKNIRYKPRGGVERVVLRQASVAQVHVPYTLGVPRFHDITENSLGLGAGAETLSAAECRGGTLYNEGRICVQVEDRGYAWKGSDGYALGEEITAWQASRVGAYTYINRWTFRDDGSIEPELGLTGRLQATRMGDAYLSYGARMNAESEPVAEVGISHIHNVYYRLDFDIGGSSNDAVERISYKPSLSASPDSTCAIPGQCGQIEFTPLETETIDFVVPDEHTSWRVFDTLQTNADGRTIGYQIEPHAVGLWTGMTSGVEPWSSGELWVTAFNRCEQLAFDNKLPYIPDECAGAAESVTSMIADNQSIRGSDIVVWYVNRFLHVVRDEDGPHMPIEWTSFAIAPRGFHYQNPLE
jgi:primary-amine oxidase